MRLHPDRSGSRGPLTGPTAWLARAMTGACVVAVTLAVSGCGTSPNPPIDFVQNYLNALGGGDFATACGMVDGQALKDLMRTKHVRSSCATLFKRCLPNRSIVLKSDQTQLLYANINVTLSDRGKIANADTSATPVATELKHVTLRHERGVWKFTGLGRAIEACRVSAHRSRHKGGRGARHGSGHGAKTTA